MQLTFFFYLSTYWQLAVNIYRPKIDILKTYHFFIIWLIKIFDIINHNYVLLFFCSFHQMPLIEHRIEEERMVAYQRFIQVID